MWSRRRPCNSPGGDQARHQRMDGAEGGRVFDAQAGEVVDVEEAPVVHRREGDAPIGQPVVLAFEQAMQCGGAGFAVAGGRRQARARSSSAAPSMSASRA